ncbi:MAG: FAD-dependent oxidoreductase [Synergistaceae bacterium]|nr:FAD-dependent oxidoreductase [Synergistaceae bacterium]
MVVGAGPAGLSAAISAAQCGHKVSVFEKNRWAGGQFRLGAVPPAKGEMVNFINWQLNELKKLDVPVNFETEVNEALVEKENPEVIIAATGATPIIPKKIKGSDGSNVVTSLDVLSGKANTGANVVVIGGGSVGAETANHLASNLRCVTLVEMLDDIAMDEQIVPRWGLLADLKKNEVKILTSTTVKEIRENSVVLSGAFEGEVKADTIVISVGSLPNTAFADALKAKGRDVRIIGDAGKVGLVAKAIMDGFLLGRAL